jgi:hypothetical protein
MLAVNLWNLLEAARPDIRFVYVTHDLTFALSRNNPRYVIASPVGGLKAVEIKTDLPKDVAEALLGSASLSFYASRIVFTEGEQGGLDDMLYSAWFNGRDTVVRPVGGCQTVLRCCEALTTSGISQGLEAVGIIDRDFGSAEFHASLPEYVHPLNVHEVESLFCLYDVVKAVAEHLGKTLCTASEYRALLASEISVAQRHSIILARWKARIEPKLMGVVAGVGKRGQDVDSLATQMPDLFDHNKWSFSPQELLAEEKAAVESILPDGAIGEILSIAPGKPLIALAARTVGQRVKEFTELVTKSLAVSYKGVHDPLSPLGKKIESALEEWLPTRRLHGSPLDN